MNEVISLMFKIKEIFQTNNPVYMFTHKDMDGAGCSLLSHFVLTNLVECNYLHYKDDMVNNKIKKFIKQNKKSWILITDLSISEETAELLDKRGRCILIDHHETSLYLIKYDWAIVNINYCATYLTYHFFTENFSFDLSEYSNLVDLINDYDTLELKYDNSVNLNRLYYLLGNIKFINRFLHEPIVKFNNFEKQYIQTEEEKTDKYIAYKCSNALKFIDTNYGKCCFVIAESETDLLAHYILENYEVDFVAIMVNLDKISLRSKKGFDVCRIAKEFGGGGHKLASSFQLNSNLTNQFINNIFKKGGMNNEL